MPLKPGDPAPDFQLSAPGGRTVRLSDYRGNKTVVLYFYPKDETPGCTVEACTFRDRYQDFVDAGAEVIGVSGDDEGSHERFASKHNLPFVLVSDPGRRVHRLYDVNALPILSGRTTYVIDREGVVRYEFSARLKFAPHVTHALEMVRTLEGGLASASTIR